MASIASNLGVGSGLDLESLLSGIMNAERLPQRRLDNKIQTVTSQISALGKLNSALAAFQTSVNKLSSANFNATKVNSSSADVATATASKNLSATQFSLNVTNLATSTKIGFAGFDSSSQVVGSGKLTFNFGEFSDATFTPSSDEAQVKSVDIPENATLTDIQNAINNANIGISATILNRNGESEIIFTSTATGNSSNFSISSDSSDLNVFDFTPGQANSDDVFTVNAGIDANFTIDGRQVSSASNTITDVIDGLSINLLKEGSTTIRLTQDSGAATSSLQAIADSYNTLLTTINEIGKNVPQDPGADEVQRKDGPLAGDPVLRSIIDQVRLEIIRPMDGAPAPYNSLASIGMEFKNDGTMTLNTDRFKAVMNEDPTAVANLFIKSDDNSHPSLTQRMSQVIENFSGTDGMVKGRITGLEARNRELQLQQEELTVRLTQIENNYRRQFTALDQLVAQNQQTMNSVIAQLNALDSQTRSK